MTFSYVLVFFMLIHTVFFSIKQQERSTMTFHSKSMTALPKIKKRNGTIADFNQEKIVSAVGRAFFEVLKDLHEEDSSAIGALVASAVKLRYSGTAAVPSVEEIQDLVEHALMDRGYYDVAKAYIIYRYEHTKIRQEEQQEVAKKIEERELLILNKKGEREIFSVERIKKTLQASVLPENAASIDIDAILSQVQREVYDGITTDEIERTLIMVARSMIERDPAYNQLAAQLTLNGLYGVGHLTNSCNLENEPWPTN